MKFCRSFNPLTPEIYMILQFPPVGKYVLLRRNRLVDAFRGGSVGWLVGRENCTEHWTLQCLDVTASGGQTDSSLRLKGFILWTRNNTSNQCELVKLIVMYTYIYCLGFAISCVNISRTLCYLMRFVLILFSVHFLFVRCRMYCFLRVCDVPVIGRRLLCKDTSHK